MARRRSVRRAYLKDIKDHEADALYSTVSELLNRLYVPLMRAYPFGDLNDPATGYRMHEVMRACPGWCKAQDVLASIAPEMRKLVLGDVEQVPDRISTVSTAVWLDTPALATAAMPLQMPPEAFAGVSPDIRYNMTTESSPRKTVMLLRSPGAGTVAGDYDIAGNRQLYLVRDRLLYPTEDTEQVRQDLITRKGVLVFMPPFKIIEHMGLYNAKLWFSRISPETSTIGAPVGYKGPTATQTFWLLPDNPYYKELQLWAETAYTIHFLIRQHTRVYMFLHQTCTTIGQLKRMWPDVATFAPHAVAVKLRAAEKSSPLPQVLRPRVLGNYEEGGIAYRNRMQRIQHQIGELTEACTRAVLLPDLSPQAKRVVNSFQMDSYYEQLPEPHTNIWNK